MISTRAIFLWQTVSHSPRCPGHPPSLPPPRKLFWPISRWFTYETWCFSNLKLAEGNSYAWFLFMGKHLENEYGCTTRPSKKWMYHMTLEINLEEIGRVKSQASTNIGPVLAPSIPFWRDATLTQIQATPESCTGLCLFWTFRWIPSHRRKSGKTHESSPTHPLHHM